MSFVLLGILNSQAAGAGGKYFFSVIGTQGDNEQFFGTGIDSQGNIIVAGGGPNYSTGLIMKFTPLGEIIWQKNLAIGEQFEYRLTIDSNDNIYLGSRANNGTLFVKYDTNGNVLWQNRWKHNSYNNSPRQPGVDNNGNILMTDHLYNFNSSRNEGAIRSVDPTNGYNNWVQAAWGQGSGRSFDIQTAFADSSDYVYAAGSGYFYQNQASFTHTLIKYRASDGNVSWQRAFGAWPSTTLTDATIDSNDNIYTWGWDNNYQSTILAKWNTDGQIQWHRAVGLSGGHQYGQYMDTDPSGNIFVTGWDTVADKRFILKYNSNGSLLWQRYLTTTYSYPRIVCDANGDFYLVSTLSPGTIGNRDGLFIYLPGDGSLTGEYTVGSNTFVYEQANMNNLSGQNYDSGTTGLSLSTYWPTQFSTEGFTQSNANLTQEITNI